MDEDEVSGLSGLAALAGGGGALDDTDKEFARSILRQSPARKATDTAFESLEADAAKARQMLQAARQRLLARPAYDERDRYLALAQAFLAPTQTGRFGESIGRAAGVLRQENAAMRQAQTARDTEEFGLDRALLDVDSNVGGARRTLALKREELETRLKGQALTALKGGKGATIDGVPMSVKETEAFLSWPKWKQQAHLRLKRANQYRTIAGIETEIDPTGGTRPLTDIDEVTGNEAEIEKAKAAAKAAAEREALTRKRVEDAQSTLDLIDEAERLIGESTGSLAGTGVDMAVGALGYSTKGSQAIRQLKIVQAGLLKFVERMEGPQSDADRKMYEQAVGQLGDSTAPREDRLAAARQIRRLQNKYLRKAASMGVTPAAPKSSQAPTAAPAPAEPTSQGAQASPGASSASPAPAKRYNPKTRRLE